MPWRYGPTSLGPLRRIRSLKSSQYLDRIIFERRLTLASLDLRFRVLKMTRNVVNEMFLGRVVENLLPKSPRLFEVNCDADVSIFETPRRGETTHVR